MRVMEYQLEHQVGDYVKGESDVHLIIIVLKLKVDGKLLGGRDVWLSSSNHWESDVDEFNDWMTCLDDEKMKKIRNDVPCHDHFEDVKFVLGQDDAILDQQFHRNSIVPDEI
ncbi:hypothetical protein Tco_0329156 [Tanacetum coccineum]